MPNNPYAIVARWDSRDLDVLMARLAPRQWPFATALMLTRLSKIVETAEHGEMGQKLDRPTGFTTHSLYTKPATKTHLESVVWFKDWAPKGTPAGEYLKPEVFGGQRREKRFERRLQAAGLLGSGHALVPASGVTLDAYGNVPRNIYNRILSQLHAQGDATANETDRSRKRSPSNRGNGGRYFYGNPGGRGRGIWERFTFVVGSSVRPIFMETTLPTYRERFAFFSVAEDTVQANYLTEFDKAAAQAESTAR
jgi:hypothetical protein